MIHLVLFALPLSPLSPRKESHTSISNRLFAREHFLREPIAQAAE